MRAKIFKKADILLIAVLIIGAFAYGFISRASASAPSAAQIVIKQNGAVIATLSRTATESIELCDSDGVRLNIVRCVDGTAAMAESSCPDKNCIQQGKITRTGEVIVCLPNRVTVEIRGGAAPEIDGVVG